MKKMGENREKLVFVIPRRKKKTPTLIYHTQLLRMILKINASLRFPTTRMLAPLFHEFCRILN